MSIEEVASVISTNQLFQLGRLYKALVIRRGMSIEKVAKAVDININILHDMEREYDQTCKAIARKQVELESLEEEEKRRRNRIVTLPKSSYRYVDNHAMNPFHYHPDPAPSSLPIKKSRSIECTNAECTLFITDQEIAIHRVHKCRMVSIYRNTLV